MNPRTRGLGGLPPEAAVRMILREERAVLPALRRAAPALGRIARAFAGAISRGGRVIYAGAGTSGRLGSLDASEMAPTFGLPPGRVVAVLAGGPRAIRRAVEGAEDDAKAGRRAIRGLRAGRRDLVVGISASGRTPFVAGALAEAAARGAATALLACVRRPALAPLARIAARIPVGPEAVAGSTRMKAGTATKIALHSVSTAAMAAVGRIRGNAMVGVRPTNRKLRTRAVRIVAALAGVGEARARALLLAARWRVAAALALPPR